MHSTRLKLRDISRAAAIVIALAAGVPGQAWAQSNATSTIFGEVSAPAGATVVLQNLATGVQRTLTPDASGRYVANSMPPGRYEVRVLRAGAVEAKQEVEALIGAGARGELRPGQRGWCSGPGADRRRESLAQPDRRVEYQQWRDLHGQGTQGAASRQ
ncbi:carboxypeptidase-like regulatory domain-containing protein [Janthinobacterium sp. AD80]|uniref:carboxypeptidase-like regulatory domain-containing protein n=1 Tax=Janthinobacterium sp. AD80 TaxID=1528773 RepID=UPI002155AC4F|nr:carboxypeptidase-like regulatory domain-containing protein [Janthinobacterium sp. AD80]